MVEYLIMGLLGITVLLDHLALWVVKADNERLRHEVSYLKGKLAGAEDKGTSMVEE